MSRRKHLACSTEGCWREGVVIGEIITGTLIFRYLCAKCAEAAEAKIVTPRREPLVTDDDVDAIRANSAARANAAAVRADSKRKALPEPPRLCEYPGCIIPRQVWIAAKSQAQSRWYCNAHGKRILSDLEARGR